jgi:MFS transporter, DHA1 family, inner membrane transport protein
MSGIPISRPVPRAQTPGKLTPPERGLASTIVLAFGTFAVGTDAFIVTGFLPEMARTLDVSPAAAGQSVTVFAVAYALLSPILATLTARVPRRVLLVYALVVLGLANIGSALAPSYGVLIATRVLAAFGAASYTPNAGAAAAAMVRPAQRARALAIVLGGLTAATAVAIPLGNLAGRTMDWRSVLALVAVLCISCAGGIFAGLPPLPGSPRIPLRKRLAVLRQRAVIAVLPLTVLGLAAGCVMWAYSIPVLTALGIAPSGILWMLFLFGLGAAAGNLMAGAATDRWGSVPVLAAGYVGMAAAMALIAWQAAAGVHSAALTGALVAGWGASIYCQTSPQQHRLIAVAPGEAALVIGLNSSAIYSGIGIGTVIGGLALPAGVPAAGVIAAVIAAAAGLYLALTRRFR